MHTHRRSSNNIALPTITNHQRIANSSFRYFQSVVEQTCIGFQDANIIRKDNIFKIDIQAGRTHLMALQFVETVGKDIKVVAISKFSKHLMCMGNDFALCGNYLKEIGSKIFGNCLSLRHTNNL